MLCLLVKSDSQVKINQIENISWLVTLYLPDKYDLLVKRN